MLQLWLCTERKRNTARMLDEVAGLAAQEQGGLLLLVPEQFSHMMERRLCARCGDRISRFAEVLGFSRLAARVFAEYGGCAQTQTDPVGRLLAMSLAARQVQARLKIYATCVDKPEFLLQMLDAFDEFQAFCVTPARLYEASRELSGALAVKTEEFALLMESYAAVCANMGQDPRTKLTRLLAALEESGYKRTVFADGFTDFNGVEREILAQLLQNGAEISVNLQCDSLEPGAQQFNVARKTARALAALAQQQGIAVQIHTLSAGTEDEPIGFLRAKLFSGGTAQYPREQTQLAFVQGAGRVAECRAAAGEMLRLVQEGARWRDISVACADFSGYRPVLESVFRRTGIPAYFAGDTDILRQPVAALLLAALEAATDAMEQEAVLAYLKSGFLPLPRDRVDRMENYALLWNLSGSRWEGEWTKNPAGPDAPFDQAELARLNEDRKRVIVPLVSLRDRLRAAKTTAEMVLALYDFTEKITLNEQIEAFARHCAEQGELQRAQEYAQISALLCGVLEQMYGVLGVAEHTPEEFYRIFRAALSQCSVGTIPAKLDCVTVGSLMSQRRCDTPYVFLLGANEGAFPSAQTERSLLTDSERTTLMQYGIELSPTAAGRLDMEIAAADSVLGAAGTRLYLGAQTGAEAYLYKRAAALFPAARRIADDTALVRRAEREYLSYLSGASGHIAAVADTLPSLAQKAQELAASRGYSHGTLRTETVRRLYGATLRLSSTKVDCLAGCRFAYFLQYGLRARERKTADLDPTLYGTFVHEVLELTTKQVMQEGGFAAVSLERALQIAQEHMERCCAERLGDVLQTPRMEYLFRRNFAEVRQVVTELCNELSVSAFEPKWFELKFAHDGSLPAVSIVGEKAAAELRGSVDRADIWRDGERVYVRVVDYKTGKKSFAYSHVFYGLGLQMLLYLFALERSGASLLGAPLMPAGVLYFPARAETVTVDDRLEEKKADKKRRENKKRSGLLLDNARVLQAMEPCEGDPVYLPYSLDKEGARRGDLASPERLARLERFVFGTVAALADELYDGQIAANPYFFDQRDNACRFCPYAGVCRSSREERWLVGPKDAKEFWQRLEADDGNV